MADRRDQARKHRDRCLTQGNYRMARLYQTVFVNAVKRANKHAVFTYRHRACPFNGFCLVEPNTGHTTDF